MRHVAEYSGDGLAQAKLNNACVANLLPMVGMMRAGTLTAQWTGLFLNPVNLVPDAATGLYPFRDNTLEQAFEKKMTKILEENSTNKKFLEYHSEELSYKKQLLAGDAKLGENPKIAYLAWDQVKNCLG